MENKILSIYRDETKILTWFIWRIFFPRFFALHYQKSMEFLSSLVIPQLLYKFFYIITSKALFNKSSRIGWNTVVHRTVWNTNEDRNSIDVC